MLYKSMQIQNIFCSAYFNRLMKLFFLRCIFESSFFRLLTLYPHEKQVCAYSYGSKVFRLQCPQRLAYFSIISSSVNSVY